MAKEKYSCFHCPAKSDYELKDLNEECPNCGRRYGFPLSDHPLKIKNIEVLKSIDRGFYGATYLGEISPFGGVKINKVIKVIPVEIYRLHNKDFLLECEQHLKLALNSNHIVQIDSNIFHEDLDVEFNNGDIIKCHIIGMEYINGSTLKKYINEAKKLSSRTIAQIAIDLITLLKELRLNEAYHNDLHPGNLLIEELPAQRKRTGELDENIRVVAIDLGSLAQKTKSNDHTQRAGDLHWVAECLNRLSRKITDTPESYDEKDWRLAFLLEEKADFLKPPIVSQKQISYDDLINQIKDTFYQHANPWEDNLKLKNFDDSVNAQSLRPWYIPNLFVDQDNNWINSITTNGPQVITGMRGCGKTMLLRALEFHARIAPQNDYEVDNKSSIIKRIHKEDKYVGLYVSCVKLLDFNAHDFNSRVDIFEPYSKLFIAYALQAIQAIKHLKYTDVNEVRNDYYLEFAMTLSTVIDNSEELKVVTSEYDLEKKLKRYLNSLSDGKSDFIIKIHPKIAFPQLANSIRLASKIFNNSYIYFLLDDVSTRYLSDKNILTLVSELLFQDENCAFKFTTEAQTLEMVIKVPGNNQQAKIGRDYTVFDLGAEVNRIIHNNHHEGKCFIEKILTKRANYYPLHPKGLSVSYILGDKSLISIADSIVREEKASEKKNIYMGLSALTAVCVGDLGDVITLYELMLKRNTKKEYPISAEIQNACFLELSNSRIYDLNRKNSEFLDFVSSFADASHQLLVQSAIRKAKSETKKLRQYTSIFVNISYGDKDAQYKKIRDLIDAGIFNFYGGPEASRTNRQGLNPEQQFKLVFRKLYGVNKHIGLSNADRFEISGEELQNWLFNPKDGVKILLRNLNPMTKEELEEEYEEYIVPDDDSIMINNAPQQGFLRFSPDEYISLDEKDKPDYNFTENKLPKVSELNSLPNDLIFDHIIIGLGFEDSTLQSAKKLALLNKCNLVLIAFDEVGKSHEIIEVFNNHGFDTSNIIHYKDLENSMPSLEGNVICDITGLPKSIIYNSVRSIVSLNNNIYIAYTEPALNYPSEEEIKAVFDREYNSNLDLLIGVSSLIRGEQGPYSINSLLPNYTNISEPRVLFSFAPIKHERLYTLLNERDYDKISIIIPEGESHKDKLAKISAEFSLTRYNNAIMHYLPVDDMNKLVSTLMKDYYNYFILNNFPFEIALTGSKLQTVGVAAFSAVFKISQCWYVKPAIWNKDRFSQGFCQTKYYHVMKPSIK